MIVRNKPNFFKLFFVVQGSVVPLVLPQISLITVIAIGVAAAYYYYPSAFPTLTLAPFALFGVAISLFLGFRNNASYDRWWEARKQWGELIVESRSLSRQVVSYIGSADSAEAYMQRRMIYLTIAFNHALRHKLRGTEPWAEIQPYLEEQDMVQLKSADNLPDALLQLMGKKLGQCRERRMLSDFLIQSLDEHITAMSSVQAACERIQHTPLPFAYMLLVQRTAYLYCLLLPFCIVTSQGLLTPVFCAVIAYTFFGFDALSEELSQPFDLSANSLPLSALSTTTERDLLHMLGESELPMPAQAKNYRLE